MEDVLHNVHDRMLSELKDICYKDEMTYWDLKNMGRMIDIIKDITTIDAMNKADKSYDFEKEYIPNKDVTHMTTHG